MIVNRLTLHNFRCFSDYTIIFDSALTILTGLNGSGKSSIIEALHYGCHFRSFRTKQIKTLIAEHKNNFIIIVELPHNTLHIARSLQQRLIKIDGTPVKSYKQINDLYKVVTLSADDLLLIQGDPHTRRSFLDEYLLLYDPTMLAAYKTTQKVLEQRNALFTPSYDPYSDYSKTWTHQLWHITLCIQKARFDFVQKLEDRLLSLLAIIGIEGSVALKYVPKKDVTIFADFNAFFKVHSTLLSSECMLKRSLFGAHLDDIEFNFNGRSCRYYASRGQQKLISVVLKIALAQLLLVDTSHLLLLIDDFLLDFDNSIRRKIICLIEQLECQIVLTATNIDTSCIIDFNYKFKHIHL